LPSSLLRSVPTSFTRAWRAIAALLEEAFGPDAPGDWRLVPTRANRLPTAASYLRAPADTEFHAFKFDVLRIEHGRIAEITTFGASLFPCLRSSLDPLGGSAVAVPNRMALAMSFATPTVTYMPCSFGPGCGRKWNNA
jgi:hypothetical protein